MLTFIRNETIGFVYFVESGCSQGYIKIGWTLDVTKRLAILQGASPYELRVLRVLPAIPAIERRLHKQFSGANIRGEWFRPTVEVLEYIEETKAHDARWWER